MLNTWFSEVDSYLSEVMLTSRGMNVGIQGADVFLPYAEGTALGAAWHEIPFWVQTGSQLLHSTCLKSFHQL